MIELYPHNQTAYDAAAAMLRQKQKAAIIHPTGTGKSFIGFKLCEAHPDETICWLSPSEYIFSTQLENLAKTTDGNRPKNIRFFTYAKLVLMSREELRQIRPSYIILDEYHRAGAFIWQQGVERLLSCYPKAAILGLSATNIRYLDNQRDMAEELFDGNIASHITLGEAIVRGILNPPKYVLSVYYYRHTLEKFEQRVRHTKSKVVRDAAEEYLEDLRRALEKADGLDVIFEKHMTNPHGKYIVFCSNKEHMDEMMKHHEWFSRVDQNPHCYFVYSEDSASAESFRAFKEDQDGSHLRLLYCIDALNEGIHVDDISGVILLRPTVSPIVYQQQIGRALSANKSNEVVIFDIVLNIENLYSIGAIEEEMELASAYYRHRGNAQQIVNEHFQIIDEVKNCRALFARLHDSLSAGWDMYYARAKEYYEQHGNLEIPARYVTEEGYTLGSWIFNQKGIRKGSLQGRLTEAQINKLDEIGMIWEDYADLNWAKNIAAARSYYQRHGDLQVPVRFVTEDGISLGKWLNSVRTWYRSGAHRKYLQPERIRQLEQMGMIWNVLDYFWERNYMAAVEYYHENGNLDVPAKYRAKDGTLLGSWLARQRKLRKGIGKGTPPTAEQIKRLDAIGMDWLERADRLWENGFLQAERYRIEHGDLEVPVKYKTEDQFPLGVWIQKQRANYRNKKLSNIRIKRLEEIGMRWRKE